MTARLFDCFTFSHEFDLLEIRLNELAPAVSHFVIAESPISFQGKTKPLHFLQNRHRFEPFADRIRHIVVEDMPTGTDETDHWRREHHQRNALLRAIPDAKPDDYIMLSDVDEIPRLSAVQSVLAKGEEGAIVHCFELAMFRYFLNLREPGPWIRTSPRLTRRRNMRSFQGLRNIRPPAASPTQSWWRWLTGSVRLGRPIRRRVLHDAGWHFSSLGGVEAYAEKLRSFSHIGPERRASPDGTMLETAADRIARALRENRDQIVPLDGSFPAHVLAHRERFQSLVLPYPVGVE